MEGVLPACLVHRHCTHIVVKAEWDGRVSWQSLKKNFLSYLVLSYLSRSLVDRWGTTVDFTTSFLHSSRFSAFRSMIFHPRPVRSLMLSSHRFLCLPLRLPPCSLWDSLGQSTDDGVTCPYHITLRLFSAGRGLYSPMAFPVLEKRQKSNENGEDTSPLMTSFLSEHDAVQIHRSCLIKSKDSLSSFACST